MLDSDTGDALATYQSGTSSTDAIFDAAFDSDGNLFFIGYSYGNWATAVGEGDFVAVKFSPLLQDTPTPAPTSRVVTPAPGVAGSTSTEISDTQAPAGVGVRTPAPLSSDHSITLTPSPTTGGEGGSTSLAAWQIAAVSVGGGVFLLLLTLCEQYIAEIQDSFLVCMMCDMKK